MATAASFAFFSLTMPASGASSESKMEIPNKLEAIKRQIENMIKAHAGQ
jgi:hypothetical protein